jgi:hypothetical protein
VADTRKPIKGDSVANDAHPVRQSGVVIRLDDRPDGRDDESVSRVEGKAGMFQGMIEERRE